MAHEQIGRGLGGKPRRTNLIGGEIPHRAVGRHHDLGESAGNLVPALSSGIEAENLLSSVDSPNHPCRTYGNLAEGARNVIPTLGRIANSSGGS